VREGNGVKVKGTTIGNAKKDCFFGGVGGKNGTKLGTRHDKNEEKTDGPEGRKGKKKKGRAGTSTGHKEKEQSNPPERGPRPRMT